MDESKSYFSSSTTNRAAISCIHYVVLGVLLAQCRLVELDHVIHVEDLTYSCIPSKNKSVHSHHHLCHVHQQSKHGHVHAKVRLPCPHVVPGIMTMSAMAHSLEHVRVCLMTRSCDRRWLSYLSRSNSNVRAEVHHGIPRWHLGPVHSQLLVECRPLQQSSLLLSMSITC
jgi:hypothetical protein